MPFVEVVHRVGIKEEWPHVDSTRPVRALAVSRLIHPGRLPGAGKWSRASRAACKRLVQQEAYSRPTAANNGQAIADRVATIASGDD